MGHVNEVVYDLSSEEILFERLLVEELDRKQQTDTVLKNRICKYKNFSFPCGKTSKQI